MWNNSIWNKELIRNDDKLGIKKWVSTAYTLISICYVVVTLENWNKVQRR